MSPRRVAAVDCGTNSTRLLVAESTEDGGFETLERLMRITRLGKGVDASGRLADDAIERTASVLREFGAVMERFGIPRRRGSVRVTATSAARDAGNRADFFAAVRDAVGVEPELLSGAAEGRLSFEGATAGLDPDTGPFLVVDVGGGSTELATGSLDERGHAHMSGVTSLDLGCVRVTEQYLHSDPPSAAELAAAEAAIAAIVEPALAGLPGASEARLFVGLAGTVAAAASIDAGLVDYDRSQVHHRVLTTGYLSDLTDRFAAMPVAERRKVVGLEHERADVIVGGLLVVRTILGATGMPSLLSSEADILDGLAASLLA